MTEVHKIYFSNHFMMYVGQIIILDTLNLHCAICRMNLNRKKKAKSQWSSGELEFGGTILLLREAALKQLTAKPTNQCWMLSSFPSFLLFFFIKKSSSDFLLWANTGVNESLIRKVKWINRTFKKRRMLCFPFDFWVTLSEKRKDISIWLQSSKEY